MDTTFFLGRETLIPHGALGMAVWREKLFALMSRNATTAMAFFRNASPIRVACARPLSSRLRCVEQSSSLASGGSKPPGA